MAYKWSHLESNQAPTDYESVALTEWAIGPKIFPVKGIAKIDKYPIFAK